MVAVDLGGTSIKAALVTSDGTIQKRAAVPTEASAGRQRVLDLLINAVEQVLVPEARAIGLGSPGQVDPATGEVNWVENIPCLNGTNIRDPIARQFGLPVQIDNDATNATRGEYLFGSGQGTKMLLGVTLGTGVGGGIIQDGHVLRGVSNYAGELGHMTYIPDGMACSCGKRGCVEAYASATALTRAARSIQKRKIPSRLLDVAPEELDARAICDLARAGDEVSAQLVEEVGKALGVVLGSVINLLNPDCIVIGGGVAAAGDILLEPIRQFASRHALPISLGACRIELGRTGNDAGLLGAAAIVFMDG